MAQKIVNLPGIGDVLLAKRHGSKSLRLTIQPNGTVRVGMPHWVPYSSAIKFAISRTDWINNNLKTHQQSILKNNDLIGKSYRLQFILDPSTKRTTTRIKTNSITINSYLDSSHPIVQSAAARASERALKKEAQKLLQIRLDEIAKQNNFNYKDLRIKRLRSRWGSCSHEGSITFNYFLIQLPWHLIDYVIVHELVHTKHLNHGQDFWTLFEKVLPNVKQLRKEVKQYRPVLLPKVVA